MAIAEQLIERIFTHPENADDGILANDLLREFHRGFPVERLQSLLSSRNETIVKIGAFIASELGSKARPLLDTMFSLLDYPDGRVRSDVIISMLTCTTEKNGKEIAKVTCLLDDLDWRIRQEIMEFLWRASTGQLKAGLRHFEAGSPASSHIDGLKWLTSENGRNVEQIASWLSSTDPLHRKYGAVAAAKIAATTNTLRDLATSSEDSNVKQFAESVLRMQPRSNNH